VELLKKAERLAKICFTRSDPEGISAIEPIAYKKRFQQKVHAIFEVESQNWKEEGWGGGDIMNNLTSPLVQGNSMPNWTKDSGGELRAGLPTVGGGRGVGAAGVGVGRTSNISAGDGSNTSGKNSFNRNPGVGNISNI